MQIEILASVFDWISKQQLNLSLFLWDWYCRKLKLTDLPGHDGKVTSEINFILSPCYRTFSADRDFLYGSLLNGRLLWAMTWNNESESESVSRISIWINFHSHRKLFSWNMWCFEICCSNLRTILLDNIIKELAILLKKCTPSLVLSKNFPLPDRKCLCLRPSFLKF